MHSKSQVRWSGPLEPFAAGFDAELARLGYTPAGTRRKLEAVAHLSCWLAERGMTADDIGTETVGAFVAARRAAGHASQLTGRSLAWMLDYLRGLGAVQPAAPEPAAGEGQLLERFGAFLTGERGLAAKTRGAHLDSARRFLAAAGRTGEDGPPLSALTASDVTAFLAGMARTQAPGTTQNTASMLRTFLTWLYAEGLIAAPLAGTVPGAYRRRRVRMPALVTGAKAAALLAACDRTTAQGLRDYAIVLILTRMGLRAREVATLTLEDVDWRQGIVTISGKGGRRDQLPLPRDVAEAVIAYLRNGRAAAALDRRLFVRSLAPHRGLTGYGVGHAVARAARDAGAGRVQPHQLRYFAATAMQAAGAPLAEIGQVLRHEDERTTSLYAKVDVAALRPLAPPWPPVPSAPRLPAGAL
ncbi:MAG TPA: tyrosine-type recombinase/integrase [Streptosporangiaceae bacterium]|jgi:site-specific recombinase XerD|nr:tyrosine-type recombinase/integrase [Streptosporangiaceae bacterium]